MFFFFFFSSRRRHTRFDCDWSSDVCSSDLVGLLMQQSTWLFDVVKLLGAAYLIYLGVTMLRSRQEDDLPSQPVAALSDMAALRTGFLTNALNPKTTVFVVSLFLQIVGQEIGRAHV